MCGGGGARGAATAQRGLASLGENFGIWSCKLSSDGKEVVAGGDGKIFSEYLRVDRRV